MATSQPTSVTPRFSKRKRHRGAGAARFFDGLLAKEPGILRLGARTDDRMLWALSNPVRVRISAAKQNVYWVDLHWHTRISWDGIGSSDASFRYARDVSALDFYLLPDGPQRRQPWDAAVYCVRLRQTNTVRGRVVMAWSSPIWVSQP